MLSIVAASSSGGSAGPPSSRSSASAAEIAPAARSSTPSPGSGCGPSPRPRSGRATIVAARRPVSSSSSAGDRAAASLIRIRSCGRSRPPAGGPISGGADPFSARRTFQSSSASAAVCTRPRRTALSSQSTRRGDTPEGPRRKRSRSLARAAPNSVSSKAISPPPTAVPATGSSASSAVAIPYDSSTEAIRGPRRAGSRRAIAISSGSAPSAISLATSVPIDSASPRSPAERSRVRSPFGGRRSLPRSPKPRSRWKRSALGVFSGSASVRVSPATPVRSRSSSSSAARAASAALPSSCGSATVTSATWARASTRSSWFCVRSSSP